MTTFRQQYLNVIRSFRIKLLLQTTNYYNDRCSSFLILGVIERFTHQANHVLINLQFLIILSSGQIFSSLTFRTNCYLTVFTFFQTIFFPNFFFLRASSKRTVDSLFLRYYSRSFYNFFLLFFPAVVIEFLSSFFLFIVQGI